METQPSSTTTFKDFLAAFLILFLTGWIGLGIIIFATLPTLGPRWLFFFMGVVALTGTAIPITYFLNRRFPSNPPAEKYIIIRQAIWFGVYGSSLAWLQMGQVLNTSLALILAGAFIVIELLLRVWEKSHWKPNP